MSFTYSHGHQVPWDQYQTDIVKKNEEIAQLKEDARTNLDYSVKYEKDLVKKNEEIAELKAKMNLSPCLYAVQYEKDLVKKNEEIAQLTQDNATLKEQMKLCIRVHTRQIVKKDEEIAEQSREIKCRKANHNIMMKDYERDLFENEELKAENEKWSCWASDVLYYSHSASKDTLQAKNLITESNQPTFTKIRNFGEEIEELKEKNDELESEVLDARESFNLQQQSDLFYCRGYIYCDPETGENMTKEGLNELRHKSYIARKEYLELKAENEKLKDEDKCVMDMLEPAIKEEVALLKAENEKLKEQMSAMVKEVKVGEDVKVGEGDVGWEKY